MALARFQPQSRPSGSPQRMSVLRHIPCWRGLWIRETTTRSMTFSTPSRQVSGRAPRPASESSTRSSGPGSHSVHCGNPRLQGRRKLMCQHRSIPRSRGSQLQYPNTALRDQGSRSRRCYSVPGSLVSSRQCCKSGAGARLSTLSGVEGLPDLSAALHPASRLGRRLDLIESSFNLLGNPSSYSGQCWKSGARARLSTLSGVEGLPDLSAALHPASRLGRRRDLIESSFNLLGTPSSYSGQCWKSGARARLSTLSGVQGLPDLSAALHPASWLGRRRDLIKSLFNLLGILSNFPRLCWKSGTCARLAILSGVEGSLISPWWCTWPYGWVVARTVWSWLLSTYQVFP